MKEERLEMRLKRWSCANHVKNLDFSSEQKKKLLKDFKMFAFLHWRVKTGLECIKSRCWGKCAVVQWVMVAKRYSGN